MNYGLLEIIILINFIINIISEMAFLYSDQSLATKTKIYGLKWERLDF